MALENSNLQYTDKSWYFATAELVNYLSFGHSFTHEQNFICSQTQLDEIAHVQIIICGQLFAGHVVGSWSMKMKKTLHQMIIMNIILPFFLSLASSHLLSDTLDVTSTVLALRTLGTFDFEGENKVNTNLC